MKETNKQNTSEGTIGVIYFLFFFFVINNNSNVGFVAAILLSDFRNWNYYFQFQEFKFFEI